MLQLLLSSLFLSLSHTSHIITHTFLFQEKEAERKFLEQKKKALLSGDLNAIRELEKKAGGRK